MPYFPHLKKKAYSHIQLKAALFHLSLVSHPLTMHAWLNLDNLFIHFGKLLSGLPQAFFPSGWTRLACPHIKRFCLLSFLVECCWTCSHLPKPFLIWGLKLDAELWIYAWRVLDSMFSWAFTNKLFGLLQNCSPTEIFWFMPKSTWVLSGAWLSVILNFHGKKTNSCLYIKWDLVSSF